MLPAADGKMPSLPKFHLRVGWRPEATSAKRLGALGAPLSPAGDTPALPKKSCPASGPDSSAFPVSMRHESSISTVFFEIMNLPCGAAE